MPVVRGRFGHDNLRFIVAIQNSSPPTYQDDQICFKDENDDDDWHRVANPQRKHSNRQKSDEIMTQHARQTIITSKHWTAKRNRRQKLTAYIK